MTSQVSPRREMILEAAIQVFGRFGFKKTSVDDLAGAAGLSKQGLYLHFDSKDDVFREAFRKYFEDGLEAVSLALAADLSLHDRLVNALDAWFGRHLATFGSDSLDVILAGARLNSDVVERAKDTFKSRVARALGEGKLKNIASPREIADVLFQCGLTWKEAGLTRAEFRKKMSLCVRVAAQVEKT